MSLTKIKVTFRDAGVIYKIIQSGLLVYVKNEEYDSYIWSIVVFGPTKNTADET